VAFCDAFVIL